MTYFRRGMGDPITDPCQVDPSLCGSGTIVGTAPPTRVDCSQIPADSPFRQPGQPCAPPASGAGPGGPAGSNGSGVTGWLLGLINPAFSTPAAGAQGMGDDTKLLLLGGAAALAYYYFRKKRRS